MEDFVILIIQAVIEALSSVPWDFMTDFTVENNYKNREIDRCLLALFVGGCLGGISLLFLPHTFLHSSHTRLLDLILGPTFSGFLGHRLAIWKNNKNVGKGVCQQFSSVSWTLIEN
jgi:hypothetical protein